MNPSNTNTAPGGAALPVPLPAALPAALVAALLVSVLSALAIPPAALAAQETPVTPPDARARPALEYEGAIATGLALRRLGNTARILHVGAHPDDENTALFAPLALGRGADAAYLSLTRGEGGQNGIGPELGTALGLIRTEELLAARGIDGAGQFFTRAVDFGFSKTAEETFEHWPRDSLLADVVFVIRRYRPDVVVSVWSGTRRDGHGQHEASGILAREAVLAAADPERFPEQIAAGLRPHAVARYFWSARYGADGPDVELNTGELDPLLGRSYHQVAMASRSRHRSQDMGVPQAPGPRRTQFDRVDPADPPEVAMGGGRPGRQVEGGPEHAGSLFAGVDTTLSRRADAAGQAEAATRLRDYEARVAAVRVGYDPYAPWEAVPPLLEARRALAAAGKALTGSWETAFHLAAEAADLEHALLTAANLELTAESAEELVVPGQTFDLELSAWNGGAEPARVRMRPDLPAGWTAHPADAAGAGPAAASPAADATVEVRPGERVVRRWAVTVPGDAALTMPYFLDAGVAPPSDGLYAWPDDVAVRALPFAPGPVRGRFGVELQVAAEDAADGTGFDVVRDAAWVGLDARSGEFRRPVRVVPRVSITLAPGLAVVPLPARGRADAGPAAGEATGRPISFTVTVRGEAPAGASGRLRAAVPEGWAVSPESVDITLAAGGAERTVRFEATPSADVAAGEYHVGAIFEAPGCGGATPCAAFEAFAHGYDVIDYPHIDPHHLYRPATGRVRVLDARVADVRVGYVAGVPDGVPEALDQLGVDWAPIDGHLLAEGDLSGFDVIVTATRAYEVRPDLVAHNQRLLDWARDGGTLIVQYNKYPALAGSYAPWPVTIARPHGRVTEESAPVTVLEPDHPVFNRPNRIGPADWAGWVQERGLYFWETWDGPLTPLLAMNDPGEEPLEGALLAAPLGEGTYVYSALALFRQLPEGVPGAWRLFANLISLGAGAP